MSCLPLAHRAGQYIRRPTGYAPNRRFRYSPYVRLFSDDALEELRG